MRYAPNNKSREIITKISLTIVLSAFVFFVFVFVALRSGFHILDWHRIDQLPAIPVYLGDFSLVFASKLLLGSITKLFSEQLTLMQLTAICGAAVFTSLAALSLLLGAVLREGLERRNLPLVFVVMLLIFNPVISLGDFRIYGSYDTYWLLIFIVLTFLSCHRGFYYITPVLCFLGTLVHFGFMVTYLPAVLAMVLYCHFHETGRTRRRLAAAVFWGTAAVCVSLTFYSLFIANHHLSMNRPEFHEYLLSRLNLTGVEEIRLKARSNGELFPFEFYEGYFYGTLESDTATTGFGLLIEKMLEPLQKAPKGIYAGYLTVSLPVLFLFDLLWAACAKRKKGKDRIPFVFFILIQAVMAVGVCISTDLWRWTRAAMISQVGLLFFSAIVKKDETVNDILSAALLKKWWIAAPAVAAGIVYVVFTMRFAQYLPTID